MTDFKRVAYIKEPLSAAPQHATYQFHVMLPEPLASWDTFDYWEKERTYSMRDNLKQGDVLFDIGAEYGWQSAVYAQMVGGENMVLFEPTKEYWPNIRQTFEANNLNAPAACFVGLASDKTTFKGNLKLHAYPKESIGKLHLGLKYGYIHEDAGYPEIKIDDFVKITGVVPDALTMDTEGSEMLILLGAHDTLAKHHPKVWVSIHPDMSKENYGTSKKSLLTMMKNLGYKSEHLATDHEEHWYFS